MVAIAKTVFAQGPDSVAALFHQATGASLSDLDAKELADICWTRASSMAKANAEEARKWGRAALAGYRFLQDHGTSLVAESAAENVAILLKWKLLKDLI